LIEKLQSLAARIQAIENLEDWQREGLLAVRSWLEIYARAEQKEPEGWVDSEGSPVDVWVIQGGRGSGKTRPGSEKIAEWATRYANTRWHLIGPTFADVRDTMIEGDSGLLSVIPESSMLGGEVDRAYNRSQLQIKLRNGSRIYGFSSEKPARLRGPQCHGWWGDEPASWKDSASLPMETGVTFSNVILGARLQAQGWPETKGVITGTPEPCGLLAGVGESPGLLMPDFEDLNVVVTRMSTLDNIDNLSPLQRRLVARLKGTRIGRQEIEGELLSDVPGALWKQAWIVVDNSLEPNQEFTHTVVAVDPAGSNNKTSDETGIVVAALDQAGKVWILEDLSGGHSLESWAGIVWDAAVRWDADAIVFEKNFGGDMGPEVLRVHKGSTSTLAKIEIVHASKGKSVRAEPVSILYEPSEGFPAGSRVKHAEHFPLLVNQMVKFTPRSTSDDRVDALVWAVLWLSEFLDMGIYDDGDDPGMWSPFDNLGTY